MIHDCWNIIGIQGDRSWPELAKLAHCRNCAAYTDAALQILESREVRPYEPAAVAPQENCVAGSSRVVTFQLGGEYLALPAASIEEIAQESAVLTLPHRRSKLPVGLVNFRGELLLFVELGAFLGTESSQKRDAPGRHVIFGDAGSRFVFRADQVCDVILHRPQDLAPVPTTLSSASYTIGLLKREGHTIACLDPERIVTALNREVA